jgi:hypothetical protein
MLLAPYHSDGIAADFHRFLFSSALAEHASLFIHFYKICRSILARCPLPVKNISQQLLLFLFFRFFPGPSAAF